MRQTDKEYGQALYMLAAEEELCEEILSCLSAVREIFLSEPEYMELLSCPAIPLEERLSVIDEAFGGRVHEYVECFLKLLCEKGRIKLLFSAIDEYSKLYAAIKGRCKAVVTSAVPLSQKQKGDIEAKLEKLTGKKTDAVYNVDPAVLGGLRIEYDGKIMDGTLKSRLADIKDVMLDE